MLGDESQLTEDLILQSATTALSQITKCATVVSNFAPKYSVISKVDVIPTGKRMYVVLLITSDGKIKNRACRLQFDLTHEHMDFFKHFMEENLEGVSVSDLSEEKLEQMITAMGTYMMTLSPLVQGICPRICSRMSCMSPGNKICFPVKIWIKQRWQGSFSTRMSFPDCWMTPSRASR